MARNIKATRPTKKLTDVSPAELANEVLPYARVSIAESWTVETIRAARREHDQGKFAASVRLRDALLTDARVFAALGQRVATPIGLPLKVEANAYQNGKGRVEAVRSDVESCFARTSTCLPHPIQKSLLIDCVMIGVAITQNIVRPRADGARWDFEVRPWPMQHARFDPYARDGLGAYVITTVGGEQEIEHGTGKWMIFEPHGPRSWMMGALRALSEPWADRQLGKAFRAENARAHGTKIPIGVLPEGIATDSKEGRAFLKLLTAIRQGKIGGIRPRGSELDLLETSSTGGHQVFADIIRNDDDEITAALLGQDGTTKKGGVYTAPVFDGVRFDLVEDDAGAFDTAVTTGLVRPYVAVNHGDPDTLAPSVRHVVPDPEEDGRLAAERAKTDGFYTTWAAHVAAGFERTQEAADALAKSYGLAAAPKLAELEAPVAPEKPAPVAEKTQEKSEPEPLVN